MIKPVAQLRPGDLVFYHGEHWLVEWCGMPYERLVSLDVPSKATYLEDYDPPVSVYAMRDLTNCIPF